MKQPDDQSGVLLAELDRRYEERLAERDRIYSERDRRYEERVQALERVINERDRRYDDRFVAQEKAVIAALASAREAVLKAEAAQERRLEGLNELRGAMSDQQRTLMSRSEVDLAVRAANEKTQGIADKVTLIQKQMDELRSERAGMKGGYGMAVAGVGLILTVVTIVALAFKAFTP